MDNQEIYGVYKGSGSRPWFGGELQRSGEPASDGPGEWAGEWFRTKKEALEYARRSEGENRAFSEDYNREMGR